MDLKERSPSFLAVKVSKNSSEKKRSPKSNKILFKPIPSVQLLQSLNMYPFTEKPSTAKKMIKPERTGNMNFDAFMKPPSITTRNVCKQLWTVEKEDKGDNKIRRGTIMKPGKNILRKTVYSRASLLQTKKSPNKKPSKCMSPSGTLVNLCRDSNIKRTLFPLPQSKQSARVSSTQRKSTSHLSVSKPKIFMKKPSVIITTAENNEFIDNNEHEQNKIDNTLLEKIFQKLTVIEDKLDKFEHMKCKCFCKTCVCGTPCASCFKFDHNRPPPIHNGVLLLRSTTKEKLNSSLQKKIEQKILEEAFWKIPTTTQEKPITINDEVFNTESRIEKQITAFNEKIAKFLDTKGSEPFKKSDQIFNKESKIIINNYKSGNTMKLKKTWITQFERLENTLLNNSNLSVNLNSSPDNSSDTPSPIQKILNEDLDKEHKIQLPLKKSPSASSVEETNPFHKTVLFKCKETDLLSDTINIYNELRNDYPKFLSTPIIKRNKCQSLMTPSVKDSKKKIISRLVQEQLQQLND